jgi:hypothetical protein
VRLVQPVNRGDGPSCTRSISSQMLSPSTTNPLVSIYPRSIKPCQTTPGTRDPARRMDDGVSVTAVSLRNCRSWTDPGPNRPRGSKPRGTGRGGRCSRTVHPAFSAGSTPFTDHSRWLTRAAVAISGIGANRPLCCTNAAKNGVRESASRGYRKHGGSDLWRHL